MKSNTANGEFLQNCTTSVFAFFKCIDSQSLYKLEESNFG